MNRGRLPDYKILLSDGDFGLVGKICRNRIDCRIGRLMYEQGFVEEEIRYGGRGRPTEETAGWVVLYSPDSCSVVQVAG